MRGKSRLVISGKLTQESRFSGGRTSSSAHHFAAERKETSAWP